MSLLIARKKQEDKLPLFDYRRLLSTCNLDVHSHAIPQFSRREIVFSSIDYSDLFKELMRIPTPKRFKLDDSESRLAIWRALFKDKPLPMIEEDAVEKYAGSLDKYLPHNVPIDKVIERAKKG